MILKILLAFAIAVGIVVALIAMQPASYTVVRTTNIGAAPAVIFVQVNDFHNWAKWSPWEKLDPAMKKTYEGPAAGAGAIYRWAGNAAAGEGMMKIADSQANQKVSIDLAFTKPYESTSRIDISVQPEGPGSSVSWTMTGQNNFALKAIALFSSMDKMIGPDFEKGLSQLKTLSESAK